MIKKIAKKKEKTKKIDKTKKVDSVDLDLLEIAEIIESLNERIFNSEKNLEEINKFLNIMSNTANYMLATMFVYERYFVDMGADRRDLQKEIDEVYFEAFTKNKNNNKLDDYKKSIIKQINEKIKQFQDKLNSNS